MWIILFFVCFYQSTSSFAQELASFDHHSAIDSSEVNQGVNWDSTRPPVTLSIQSGRSGRVNRTQDATYDDSRQLFYSNQWQPILMPIGFNNQRYDRNTYQVENVYSPNSQFTPTFLRRPDSDENRTALFDTTNPEIKARDVMSPASIPLAPFMLYPPAFNFHPSMNNQVINKNAQQNSSTLLPDRVVTDSESSQSETSQTENLPLTPGISRRIFPANSYDQAEGFLPPRSSPYNTPYPFLPYLGFPPFHPAFNPNFNRQLGMGSPISPSDVPQTPSGNSPDFVRDTEVNLDDSIPEEAPSNIRPLPSLPFPAGGYPYGLMPPFFAPPFLPSAPSRGRSVVPSGPLSRDPFTANFLPRGAPFNPFIPPPTNILPDPQISGEILPPPAPIPEANLPLEDSPLAGGVIPQVPNLQPELEVPAELQAEAETILEGESQNAVKVPYEYGFDLNDGQGTLQHRKEVSDGAGVVTGSYSFRDPFHVYRWVNYIADKNGFRAFIKTNEPGMASGGSANVVVMAESPPPEAIIEGLKASEPQAVIVPDATADLVAEGSEAEKK